LLKSQILKSKLYRPINEDDLNTAASWLSGCEQKAAKSERQIQAIKKARFMEKFLGDEFEGMINSVARFGVFVLLREYDIDGLVKLDDLSTQRLEYDESTLSLFNKRTGLRYTIGDTIKVKVISADHELGQINFMPLDVVAKKEKQNEQYIKDDLRKIKDEQKKQQQPSHAQFKKGKKSLVEKMFRKKKNQTHFSSNKKDVESHKTSIKFRGSLSEKFAGDEKRNDFFNPKQESLSEKPAWKPTGIEYNVNSSKRNSILDKLDQAIASRERNHFFSAGSKNSKPSSPEETPVDKSSSPKKNKQQQKERNFGSGNKAESSRKNSKKRSKTKNHRRGVR
jgi:ribonuclease R